MNVSSYWGGGDFGESEDGAVEEGEEEERFGRGFCSEAGGEGRDKLGGGRGMVCFRRIESGNSGSDFGMLGGACGLERKRGRSDC